MPRTAVEVRADIAKVNAEECRCVRCSWCGGSGRERCGDYLGDSECCDECGGSGIVQNCERCQLLTDLGYELEEMEGKVAK